MFDIECLEARQLLSVALEGDVLRIVGTNGPDRIRVVQRQDRLVVQYNGKNQAFLAENVSRIVIRALGGNDVVAVRDTQIPAWIHGGAGDDELIGGDGDDTIIGGRGNDRIFGRGGNDLLISGPGRNFLHGGPGDDILDARNGQRDTLWGGAGRDTLLFDKGIDFADRLFVQLMKRPSLR